MKHRKLFIFCTTLVLLTMLSTTAFAIDESEIEAAISAAGEDAVAGNIFIWFLCAVAFLKVSQKIDSFMTSLGINVGRTGGSMLAEMMIAGRALGSAAKATGGAIGNIFHSGRSGGSGAAAGQAFSAAGEGLAGAAAAAVGNAAAGAATGTGSGLSNVLGGAMFDSSLENGGQLATNVISAVATGNIASVGSITGEKASKALTSYLGYGGGSGAGPSFSGSVPSGSSGIPTSPSIDGDDIISAEGGATAAAAAYADSISDQINDAQQHIPQQPPTFRDVEIGGGRITGYETPASGSDERQFAMYNASQYMSPQGDYETVETADGETWYKQYAKPAVEREPYQEGGQIKYNERIVNQMPQVPRRKDRI